MFQLPFGCRTDVDLDRDVFRYEIGRYHAQAQVAYDNFVDPTFMEARLIVFSEDVFGVFWVGLRSMGAFERIHDDISGKDSNEEIIKRLSLT